MKNTNDPIEFEDIIKLKPYLTSSLESKNNWNLNLTRNNKFIKFKNKHKTY